MTQVYSPVSEAEQKLLARDRYRYSRHLRKLTGSLPLEQAERLEKQFIPDRAELSEPPGFSPDPLREEEEINPLPFIVHKYPARLLLLTTSECPVFCRYCTRKRRTLRAVEKTSVNRAQLADYLTDHPEVKEVILSGGDPFMLSDRELFAITRLLSRFNLLSLRFHTRTLTALPHRFRPATLGRLAALNRDNQVTIVTHINTAAEISPETEQIVSELKKAGIIILNQSVLLARINDEARILCELSVKLHETGILPYYLHQLDRVSGSAHFEVEPERGRRLLYEMRQQLPGFLVPRYMLDSHEGKSVLG